MARDTLTDNFRNLRITVPLNKKKRKLGRRTRRTSPVKNSRNQSVWDETLSKLQVKMKPEGPKREESRKLDTIVNWTSMPKTPYLSTSYLMKNFAKNQSQRMKFQLLENLIMDTSGSMIEMFRDPLALKLQHLALEN